MKTIAGITVPDVMFNDAKYKQNEGYRVAIGSPDEAGGACANCGGSGSLIMTVYLAGPYAVPPQGNISFIGGSWYRVENKSYPCPVCNSEGAALIVPSLFADSGLNAIEQGWHLNYIDGMEGKDFALIEARKMLAKTPTPNGWLTIFGDYGVGKTGILKALVAAFIRAGVKAKYIRAADYVSRLRSTFDDSSRTEEQVMREHMRYTFLAVDEVDRVSDTEWARSAIFSLLDERYASRFTLATAMATNQYPDRMGEQWEYLMSRMTDGVRVPVGGISLRGDVNA